MSGDNIYTTSTRCANCGWGGRVGLTLGLAPEKAKCPRCKTRHLYGSPLLWPWERLRRKRLAFRD